MTRLTIIYLVGRLRVVRVTNMYQRYSETLSEDPVLEKYNVTQREKYGTRQHDDYEGQFCVRQR